MRTGSFTARRPFTAEMPRHVIEAEIERLPVTAPAGGMASLQETLAGRGFGSPSRAPSRLEEAVMMRGGM